MQQSNQSATNSHFQAGQPWHNLTAEAVLDHLGTSASGLRSDQAQSREAQYGPNEIRKKQRDSILHLLWRQINSPLIWVLLASGTIAVALGKITDGLVVLAVVLINAVIGFIQEFKAEQAIEALSSMVPQTATVIRDDKMYTLPAVQLVPGDIVQLAAGDSIPADMRLLSLKNLQVEEAALTGESVPVGKSVAPVLLEAILGDRTCMVYSGTLVTAGTALAVVTGIGMATELGRISDMLDSAVDLDTPLTRQLAKVSQYITIGIILLAAVILTFGVNRALDQGIALAAAIKETLIFAIALAVGAIPEGLPAVVTIALAIGVQRMARRNAIIRKLPAVETLGSTTIICTDKTGTLTCNEMTVTELWTLHHSCRISGIGYAPEGHFFINDLRQNDLDDELKTLLRYGILCNDATLHYYKGDWEITGDPTEAALLVAAAKAGFAADEIQANQPRLDAQPFASEHQYMATLHGDSQRTVIIKGAPEVILGRCGSGTEQQETFRLVSQAMLRMGERGMRVLALAARTLPTDAVDTLHPDTVLQDFTFVGLFGMIDPPRTEAVEAIAACHRAGITVKMITGDHRATALAIGADLNLVSDGQAVTGAELAVMDDQALAIAAQSCNIFARVAPEHKLRLVKALQQGNQVVAMTGDGVNDAPSLKQANIGVAMGITGTAVARESADIILADDNFASISAAVEEGRRVYDNLLKSLAFLLPTNLGLALILIYGILFFPFDPLTKTLLLPMLPTQLLWINLVAAVTLALPLAFEVKESDIMHRPPRKPDAPLFNSFVVLRVVMVSVLMTAGTLMLFNWEYQQKLLTGLAKPQALAKAQTMAVTYVVLFQVFYMIHCRSLKDSLLKIGLFSNPTVFWGIGLILGFQALFVYLPFMQQVFRTAPMGIQEIALCTAASMVILPIITAEKWLRSLVGRTTMRN